MNEVNEAGEGKGTSEESQGLVNEMSALGPPLSEANSVILNYKFVSLIGAP